ncbi:MAG: ATP-binding protein, partial [Mycobacteriales bacterium]
VQQYDLRRNVAQMFVNLARRSQTLVDRQIQLIDQLEQSERDPDRLEDLFKLDHLATRMRRNDENLLVLAGEESARRWSRPVPLVNVLRAAASEVEQYARIELTGIETDLAVSGHAVNDLVHLVAELLENATSFSSPRTKVIVASRMVGPNCMVEIEDQGIGMSPAQLAEINERLSRPPVIDVTLSKTMGLFVVGRLSARHRVKVQLRSSPLGGVIAMVLLPLEAIVRPPAAPTPAALGGGTARQFQQPDATGRPALPAGAPGSPSGPGNPFGTPAPTGAYGGSYDNPYESSYGPGSPPAALPSSPYVSGSDLPYRTPGASGGEPPATGSSHSGPLFTTGDVRPWRPESGPPDARPEPRRSPPPAEPAAAGAPGDAGQIDQGDQVDQVDEGFAERAEPVDGGGPRPTPGFRLDGPGAAFLDADTHALPRIGGPDAPLEPRRQDAPEPVAGEVVPAVPEPPADQDQPGMESQIMPAVSSTPPPPPTTAPPTRTVIPRVADVDPPRPPARAPETAAARAAATPQPADDDGLLIFSAVESEWFRSRTPGGQVMGQPGSGDSPEPAPEERAWDTPADEGWRAAEVAARPPTGGFTRSGLPIRVPQAQLVPGSAAPAAGRSAAPVPAASPVPVPPPDAGPMEPMGPPGKHRTPESVRGLLSSYRQGIERGREAGRRGLAGTDERENV